jgi:murein DD-endopeptidase MepM/ murein hydrolase activator NlpD
MKKENHYSIVFVPPNSTTSKTLKIKVRTLYAIVTTILVALTALSITLYINLNASVQQTKVTQLKEENALQRKQIKAQNDALNDIHHELELLIEKEEEIQTILGETKIRSKSYRRKIKNNTKKKVDKFKKSYLNLEKEQPSKNMLVAEKIEFLDDYIVTRKENFNYLLDRAHQFKTRFAATPSIQPVYGRLLSRFGWRKHPITGKRRMHKGLDFAAWIGAPIQATADGVIEYAGWSGTFGYVVVIDHGYGYRTIYAHCSQLLVKKRDLVKKGQIIAQVGTTGISTGPHLHYEVRRWRQAVNPVAYLDLDMFTASRRIW